MGALTKIALAYDEPFWPPNQYVFGYLSPQADEHPTTVVNMWKSHGRPVLVLLIGGDKGREIEGWPEARVLEWARSILGQLFGPVPAPRSVVTTRWASDPFALGSYSYVAVGATPTDIEALAEPVGESLLFAGEATVRTHWACVHSAYVSGLREAARLTGDAAILPARHFTENRRWREMLQRADRFFNVVGRQVPVREVDARVAVLRRSPVFARVPAGDLRIVATMFERRQLADGETLCAAGDPATCMYAVESGEVGVYLPGQPQPVAAMSAGDVVGEYGMFLAGNRTATLRARGATSVLALDYQRLKLFLLTFPESMLALMSLTVARLSESQTPGQPLRPR
jgi:hypothetical protein